MNIIILADKYQKRMKSRGCVGLIKFNNKNILHHQYHTLKAKFPNANIIYIYGFENKRLVSYISKNILTYPNLISINNNHYDKYNNTYSLSLIENYLNNDCLIMFGDHIIKNNTFNKFKPTEESQVFINTKNKTRLGCIINENVIENISYDLNNYLSEIYFVSKNQSNLFRDFVNNPLNRNCFIFEIFNKMINHNQKVIPHYIS